MVPQFKFWPMPSQLNSVIFSSVSRECIYQSEIEIEAQINEERPEGKSSLPSQRKSDLRKIKEGIWR